MKECLESNNIRNPPRSDFRMKHSPATAAQKVFNGVCEALERKRFSVALFIDLFKAFDAGTQSLVRLTSRLASPNKLPLGLPII